MIAERASALRTAHTLVLDAHSIMEAISPILNRYDCGASALLITGRRLSDLDLDEDGVIRPLRRGLRTQLRERGVVLVEYNQASGLRWHASSIEDERDRQTIEEELRRHDLLDVPQDEHEVPRIFRGLDSLLRTPPDHLSWADGDPMRFGVLVSFGEHLVPDVSAGMHTDPQAIAAEVASMLGESLALQSSGNLFLIEGRDEMIDPLVRDLLLEVRLPQPDGEAKKKFLSAVSDLYDRAELEGGMYVDQVANLVGNTPNRSQESLFRASHYGDAPVTAEDLSDRKARDIEALSEGTLTLMEQDGIEPLVGSSVETPQHVLDRCAEGLRNARSNMPANVVLLGAPGTGKTVMTLNLAQRAGVPAFEMHSPKDGVVGETERLARVQRQILADLTPHIVFVDEISEALPMERNDYDGDGGASRAVGASLLQVLSDEDRRGHSLLVGATNCPWRFGAAMLKRFTCIPVLFPVRPDYPDILASTFQQVSDEMKAEEPEALAETEFVQEAAQIFYRKTASARDMRSALDNTVLMEGTLAPNQVVQAARNFTGRTDRPSLIHSELWAIKATSSKAFFPWNADPESFPFPDYLDGIVDPETGDIDHRELDQRIEEFEPYANV